MTAPDAGLGATIRAWRDRLPPSAVGLSAGRGRRAVGLRREDLAELAGMSVDYVVRLEQGRATTPSAQVVGSLARALQLSTGERDHLFRLARLVPPADEEISDHIPPGVQRLVHRLGDVAVAVFAADWQLIWWNRGWAALVGDPSSTAPSQRNFALDTFPVDGGGQGGRADRGPHLSHWPVTTFVGDPVDAAVVSDLRRATGRFPHSRRLTDLIRTLIAGNADFARLWAAGTVAAHREDQKIVDHPVVGPVRVSCDVLTDGDLDLKIVILSAAPDSEDETRLRLAMVSGVTDLGVSSSEPAPLRHR